MFQDPRPESCQSRESTLGGTDTHDYYKKIAEALKSPGTREFLDAVTELDSIFGRDLSQARQAAVDGKWDSYSPAHTLPIYSELKGHSTAILNKLKSNCPINEVDRRAIETLLDYAERGLYCEQHGTTGDSGILDTGEFVNETYLMDTEPKQLWGFLPPLPPVSTDEA